jgi:rod shape determining protein RodA
MDVRRLQDFNFYLFVSVLVLAGFGSAMVYSTMIGNSFTGELWSLGSPFTLHMIWLGIGFSLMIFFAVFDYQNLRLLTRPIYIAMLLLLGYTLVAGNVAGGARSWLVGSSGQPTEIAKLLLIICLAGWWAGRDEQRSSWTTLLGSLLMAGVPLLMVLVQPDFGSAMVIGLTWLAMVWVAGMRWKQVGILALLAIPLLFVGWNYLMQDYQRGRLIAFAMSREEVEQLRDQPQVYEAAQAVYYNVNASKVAVGNGGLLGKGLLNGTQSQRNFLPVQYTDFVFAVTAEELGFVGASAMLAFLCVVLWQAVTVAARARDTFGRLIATGIFAMLLVHTLENIGMNLGLMPVTGIPLPFISYGGSFTITVLAAMGLLIGIDMRRRVLAF